jgi:hypothetical protein
MPRPPFTSPGDFNGQLQQFLAPREHPAPSGARVLWSRRADRIDADRATIRPLPPVPPTTGWRSSTWLPRDHYIRLDSNDCSVHHADR